MRNVKYCVLILALFLGSCGGQDPGSSSWNSMTGTYTIPSLGISYTVPSAVENWAIADTDGSVPAIKFCGVDHSTGICVVIVEPDRRLKSVTDLDEDKALGILREISCQSPAGRILRFEPSVEKRRYADSEHWRLRADITIATDSDTVGISYVGNIFDCPNRRVAGIVSIVPSGVYDSVLVQTVEKYFEGVSPLLKD